MIVIQIKLEKKQQQRQKMLTCIRPDISSSCPARWTTVSKVKPHVAPAGKLGHGDTNRVYKPKVVEALQGMFIRKVCAGSQSSLALTSTGQVDLELLTSFDSCFSSQHTH